MSDDAQAWFDRNLDKLPDYFATWDSPKDIQSLEICGCRKDNENVWVDNESPEFFSVYTRDADEAESLANCIGDFNTAEEARTYAQSLSQRYGWPVNDFTQPNMEAMKAKKLVNHLLEAEPLEPDDVDPEVWIDQHKDALHAQNYSLRSPTNPGGNGDMPHRIVLHHSMSSRPEREEWVTHMETVPADGRGAGYHWGHYITDYAKALEDFKERCANIKVDWSQSEKFVDE